MTYLVLGATGKTGRHVVSALAARGVTVRAASRATGFHWEDPSTWDDVLAGVRGVYLVENDENPDPVADFAKRAAAAGARRLVFLSARSGDAVTLAPKRESERAVAEAGVPWTALRPSWFTQNFTEFPVFADPLATGVLRLPTGDGREPFIDTRDIAEVAAAALLDEGHEGRIYELTGPRALSFPEFLAEYAEATGRALRFEPVSEESYRAESAAAGVPDEFTELLIRLFREIRHDGGASIAPGVREVLGRAPRDPAVWMADQARE